MTLRIKLAEPRQLIAEVVAGLDLALQEPPGAREGRLVGALISLVALELSRQGGSEVPDKEFRALREALATRLPALADAFDSFQFDVNVAASNAMSGGWYWASLGRSILQFLLDEYSDVRVTSIIDRRNLEEIDEFLEDYCEQVPSLPAGDIPPHMPRQHRWWWLPKQATDS